MQAQRFYHQNSLPTRVKACVTLNLDELIMLAGIDALTIAPKVLKVLAATERPQDEVESMSLFAKTAKATEIVKYPSYIDSESQYRVHFAASEGGKAQFKTAQVRLHFQLVFIVQPRLINLEYRQFLCFVMLKRRWSCTSRLNWRILLTSQSIYEVPLWLANQLLVRWVVNGKEIQDIIKDTHLQETP